MKTIDPTTLADTNPCPVRVGQYGTFRGLDRRGAVTMTGRVTRVDRDDAGDWRAAIRLDAVVDKHRGLVRYNRADVTMTLRLTGDLVDALHGQPRRPAAAVA